MQEIWKDVIDTDGNYQVSNFGNIRSRYNKYDHKIHNEYTMLKPFKDKKGYVRIRIKDWGRIKC